MGRLGERDVVTVPFSADAPGAADADVSASVELVVHRRLYRALPDARAVAHAHTPYATALSFGTDWIEPADSEAKLILGRVPVVACETTIGSPVAADLLAAALVDSGCPVAVLRGHGPFAAAADLSDAWRAISVLEMSCKILTILHP